MRRAGSLLAEVASVLREQVVQGNTPLALNNLAEAEILKRGCIPAFKGYRGYQHTLCVSVNSTVVHGIPSGRQFQDDDVVSVDLGLAHLGYYADMAFTIVLGQNRNARKLASATEEALLAGIRAAHSGNRIGDIGNAIQAVALREGLGIVREFVGHGIGTALHLPPSVPNFGKAGRGQLLTEGMTLAIEPMFTLGREQVRILGDGWTVETVDRSLAAHAEHTILVTKNGPEILTEYHG